MKYKILRSLAIHIAVMFTALSAYHTLPYAYRLTLFGPHLFLADGSSTTVWQYFTLLWMWPSLINTISEIFLFVPLVEFIYWFVFRKDQIAKGLLYSFITGALLVFIHQVQWDKDRFENNPLYFVLSFLMYSGYAIIYGMIRKYIHDQTYRKELQLQQSENELKALKAQLNPHFFFNGLNYIYGTALNENAPTTAEAINLLSVMMRYSITGMKENFVPIKEEINFIKSFLSFQEARLIKKDSITVESDITIDHDNYTIAPLILLPFIENAFKYGISIDNLCFVKIAIEVRNAKLSMTVINRIIHEHDEVKGNDTGIINTRKRLELLYENNYSLKYGEDGEVYRVHLSINLT